MPCTKGYEGTTKYLANGQPLKGGPKQKSDSPPNFDAGCTAPPNDPNTPNVRGAQNVPGPNASSNRAAVGGMAMFDPNSGTIASPEGAYRIDPANAPAPPTGKDGLAWLISRPLH